MGQYTVDSTEESAPAAGLAEILEKIELELIFRLIFSYYRGGII